MAGNRLIELTARVFAVSFVAYAILHFVPGGEAACAACGGIAAISGFGFLVLTG